MELEDDDESTFISSHGKKTLNPSAVSLLCQVSEISRLQKSGPFTNFQEHVGQKGGGGQPKMLLALRAY